MCIYVCDNSDVNTEIGQRGGKEERLQQCIWGRLKGRMMQQQGRGEERLTIGRKGGWFSDREEGRSV